MIVAPASGNARPRETINPGQSRATGAQKATVLQDLIISGISVGGATCATNPLDVIKTRLQLNDRKATPGAPRPGLIKTGVNIVRHEGAFALWNGLPPAVARGFLYGGMRLGLYEPCKGLLLAAGQLAAPTPSALPTTSSSPSSATSAPQSAAAAGVGLKVAAGLASGALAAGLTSPTELIKTRLQAKDNTSRGTLEVIRTVVKSDGVQGLWRGAVPSMVRAALLTASQVATYDSVKREIIRAGGGSDSVWTHVAASGVTGLVTTTVTNPVDVVKTHMFVSGAGARKGILQTTMAILYNDGILGFMKGWTASYARLGPQTVFIFLISEGLRKALGLEGL
ncbi:hypothetical protein CHLRE_06g257550v5 [Chlamydomonas reinhardtii]|uniref:Uncharacterized protein n=1 Tax=Chlamydomonas reinhardtii TaxID=3055 RepID=A8HXY9_CHLRE|nr:uncharacterized protein CHLRE_06g257550v5 [Chlamydomonas reinhardtii]PNW81722.1 hypothetical protein CHLRE_06g257550v5 [Chlamydomonas reinhardtii]|eukprot:XP_001696360.1 uncoupling protein [Chlamydomonas reinhardtii]